MKVIAGKSKTEIAALCKKNGIKLTDAVEHIEGVDGIGCALYRRSKNDRGAGKGAERCARQKLRHRRKKTVRSWLQGMNRQRWTVVLLAGLLLTVIALPEKYRRETDDTTGEKHLTASQTTQEQKSEARRKTGESS